MIVQTATETDIASWVNLAAEVEPLFGPMIRDPGFHRSLHRHIAEGTAFCVRDDDSNEAAILGGLLFSSKNVPIYKIGWLAVSQRARGRGIGGALMRHALALVETPAEVILTKFGEDVPGGEAARRLYHRLGFLPAEPAPNGPEGGSRQVFRLRL